LGKFRGKNINWREFIPRLEADIPKGAVSYTVQERETEGRKLSDGKERDLLHVTVVCKGIIIIIIIIITLALQK